MKLELNVNRDDPTTNDFIWISEKYGQIPNKVFLHDAFSGTHFEEVINELKKDDINKVSEYIPNGKTYILNKKVLVELDDEIYCSYLIINESTDDHFIEEVAFYYKESEKEEDIKKIIEKIVKHTIEIDLSGTQVKLNTISISANKIDIVPLSHKKSEIESKYFYNKETYSNIKSLVKRINSTDKGISIFYGQNGTGKTDIMYHLSEIIDRTIIFIPNNAVDITINSPEFKDFINKYEKPLLVIDDCEFHTSGMFNYFTTNIIQLCDGVVCDDIQTLLIFNTKKPDIDKDLINCGNILDIIHFDKLSGKRATKLSEKLGHDKDYDNPTLLSEVYKNNEGKHKKKRIGL